MTASRSIIYEFGINVQIGRNFAYSIGAAWIITVPASATIAGTIYYLLSITSLLILI